MSDLRKAAQQALEAWEASLRWPFPANPHAAFETLRAALAQPEPLTDDQINEIADSVVNRFAFARAIEAAHGIGEWWPVFKRAAADSEGGEV